MKIGMHHFGTKDVWENLVRLLFFFLLQLFNSLFHPVSYFNEFILNIYFCIAYDLCAAVASAVKSAIAAVESTNETTNETTNATTDFTAVTTTLTTTNKATFSISNEPTKRATIFSAQLSTNFSADKGSL